MRKPQEKIQNEKLAKRIRRKLSIRKKVSGTAERPRVCVNKTNSNLYVQVVDDNSGKILLAVKTYGEGAPAKGSNKEAAAKVGKVVAEKMSKLKLNNAVFDRNGFKFSGVIEVLAKSIKDSGIQI